MTERKAGNFSITAGIGFITESVSAVPTGVVIGERYRR